MILSARCCFCKQLISMSDLVTVGKPKRNAHTQCALDYFASIKR